MKKEILNPNCSEIIWRLNGYRREGRNEMETDTSSYPNGCVEEMVSLLEEAKKKKIKMDNISVKFVDNRGGGGNWDFVEDCFPIAMKVAKGEITIKEALKIERKLMGG